MELLIFTVAYILIGCIIDLLITKGMQKPNAVMIMIWPFFLLISIFIVLSEMMEDSK